MKRAPHINFALDRSAQQRRNKLLMAVLGLALGVQLGLAAWRLQNLQSSYQALQGQQQQILSKNAQHTVSTLSADQTSAVMQAHAMLSAVGVPWESLLSAIESARTSNIVLEALQPNWQDRSVSLTVVAPNFYELAEFLRRLQQQEAFQNVRLVSEALPENGAGNLRVVISATWSQPQ